MSNDIEYLIECPDKDFDLILKEYKEIPLTQGKVTLVDVEDYEKLSKYKWCAHHRKGYTYYAIRSIYINGIILTERMHRIILKAPKDAHVDHINGDGLDNRKWNLRLCTRSQNLCNSSIKRNNTSGYKGVRLDKWIGYKKWRAYIWTNGRQKYIGNFSCKNEAAKAYNETATKYYGEFAKLNIIKGGDIDEK